MATDVEGLYPILLTKALLLDIRFCHAFFQLDYLMADLANASATFWNAEDIYMSLVAKKVPPQGLSLPVFVQTCHADLTPTAQHNGLPTVPEQAGMLQKAV